jgi:HPt (histidine-containing phosphotransfer) domain-containing protein
MDVQMPEMDGLEATRLIRERERQTGGHVPIVAMTAHAMKGDKELCLSSGMDDYISKPIRVKEVAKIIEQLFAESAETGVRTADAAIGGSQIDWPAARAVVEGDEALLRNLVEAVLEELPPLLEQLEQAICNGDAATARRAAHTIKGAVRTFDPTEVIDLAGRLEAQGKAGTLDNAVELFDRLKQQLQGVTHELAAHLSEYNPTAAASASPR